MRRMKSGKEICFLPCLLKRKFQTLFRVYIVFSFILLKNNQNFYNHSQKLNFVLHLGRKKFVEKIFFKNPDKILHKEHLFNDIKTDEFFDQFSDPIKLSKLPVVNDERHLSQWST